MIRSKAVPMVLAAAGAVALTSCDSGPAPMSSTAVAQEPRAPRFDVDPGLA